MKSFIAAVVAALVVAVGAVYVLDATQRRADQAYASATGARIPDHGTTHNLVGKDWYSPREH
jgi:hypothetical protein